MRTCDFSNAKVGDKVFCLLNGEGVIIYIDDGSYPICVEFNSYRESYLNDGRINENNSFPTLYHRKFDIRIPEEAYLPSLPDIAVDTVLKVWGGSIKKENALYRYFKKWSRHGKPICFNFGQTSITSKGSVIEWANYEIVDNTVFIYSKEDK